MTELSDSDLTESQEMSLSGRVTPDAKRRDIKRTEAQRLAAAHKRRAWILEQSSVETRNKLAAETRNDTAEIG